MKPYIVMIDHEVIGLYRSRKKAKKIFDLLRERRPTEHIKIFDTFNHRLLVEHCPSEKVMG